MKTIRIVFFTAALCFGVPGSACAQVQSLRTSAPAPVLLRAVPADAVPRTGTFYSLQRPDYPPLPFDPFPDLPLYASLDGWFVVDDSSVDYPTPDPEALTAALTRSLASASSGLFAAPLGGGQSPANYSPDPPPCGDGSTPWLAEFGSALESNGTATVSFRIAGGSNDVAYQIYRTADLTNSLANGQWTWLGQGYACQSYTFSNQPPAEAFYTLGPPPLTMVVAWGGDSSGQCEVPFSLSNVVQVAAGYFHNIALSAGGKVVTWGESNFVANVVPADLPRAQAVTASWYHNVALLTDGTVRAWGLQGGGNVSWGLTNVPAGLTNVTAVAAGALHTLALQSNGTVVAWGAGHGENDMFNFGQSIVPAGLTNAIAIAAGGFHSLALRGDGTLTGWGDNDFGQTNAPAGATNLTAIAAGWMHNVALKQNGTVLAWGNTNDNRCAVPAGLSNVVAVAAGLYHSLALRADGTVVVWGSLPDFPYPAAQGHIVAIASGTLHALALRTPPLTPMITAQPVSQTVTNYGSPSFTVKVASVETPTYQWQFEGVNLDTATNATLTLPNVQTNQAGDYRVIVANSVGIVTSTVARLIFLLPPQILSTTPPAPGSYIITNGFLLSVAATNATMDQYPLHYQWYRNGSAITAATNANLWQAPQWTPWWQTNAADGDYTVSVWNAAGTNQAGAWTIRYRSVPKDGLVVAWGANDSGQIEYPTNLTNAIAIAAGQYHSAAVQEDGTVILWGHDWGAPPADLTNAVAVAAGYDHTLALRDNGNVVAWGDPESAGRWVPTNLCGVKAIAAGWSHNLALLTNGQVRAWGNNAGGPAWSLTNVPSTAFDCIAIAAGPSHSLAVKADGTVVAWGTGGDWQTNVPAGLTNVVAVAAGGNHSLVLRADGRLVAWGDNSYGQSTVPSGLSNVMAVAAGWAHSVALKNDGTVVMWGDNTYGQTNLSVTLGNVKLIAAGGNHTLAAVFSPLVQYNVDVSKDLLLIYNTNSVDSSNVWSYYMQHRPMVSNANVLGIASPTSYGAPTNETALPEEFTNNIAGPMLRWLTDNPTKRPQYVIFFPDLPTRVNEINTNDLSNQDHPIYYYGGLSVRANVGAQLREMMPGWQPFLTYINMGGTNNCKAYIDKLESIGISKSPGKLILSASVGGYGNTNYYFDDTNVGYGPGATAAQLDYASNGVVASGASPLSVFYVGRSETWASPGLHLTNGINIAGYACWGGHSTLYRTFVTNGTVHFSGNSGWYLMMTIESTDGHRVDTDYSTFVDWYSANAFGGTSWASTPVGAVATTDEPFGPGIANGPSYFGLWQRGRVFAICAWNGKRSPEHFLAVGDPLVKR